MKTSSFRIVPLRTEIAEAARREAKAGAPDHAFVTADSPEDFPAGIASVGPSPANA